MSTLRTTSSGNTYIFPRFPRRIYYGWVIVSLCTLIIAVSYGLMYSYSVFFKPITVYFKWDRATVSSIYSVSLFLRGAAAIYVGWLADRYGARTWVAFCGVMTGLGLILSSRVNSLWQFYLAYGVIESIGLSGAFTISNAVTTKWFSDKRGLALGLISTGSGLGTLIIVPMADHLLRFYSWPAVFAILGVASGSILVATAAFLREVPTFKGKKVHFVKVRAAVDKQAANFRQAALSREMAALLMIYGLIFFCIQLVMIHLVNIATDMGISSLQAAGFVSVIGVLSIIGRIIMGGASDRIGNSASLIVCSVIRVVSFVLLFYCHTPFMFYCFAALFGFAYGGEVPQIPMFVVHLFGVRNMAALIGLLLCVSNIGGALGPWMAGKIFDVTHAYYDAILAGIAASVIILALAVAFKLKYRDS